MLKFKLWTKTPKYTEYFITADYPEAAKSEAAKRHRRLHPEFTRNEIINELHCFLVDPKSGGRSYKKPTFLSRIYETYYGENQKGG